MFLLPLCLGGFPTDGSRLCFSENKYKIKSNFDRHTDKHIFWNDRNIRSQETAWKSAEHTSARAVPLAVVAHIARWACARKGIVAIIARASILTRSGGTFIDIHVASLDPRGDVIWIGLILQPSRRARIARISDQRLYEISCAINGGDRTLACSRAVVGR